MPRLLETLGEVAGSFDAIVFDQWGVLHDGSAPYPGAVEAVRALHEAGTRLAVLSNSGRRAGPNAARITGLGFAGDLFERVMTSGEALWQDIASGRLSFPRLCPVARAPDDAVEWADGLAVSLTDDPDSADAILLMGLPDDEGAGAAEATLAQALLRGIPVLCTNPDRASPRAGGTVVVSPGALAHAHAKAGGTVHFYGKPHAPVFSAVESALGLPPARLLMVGDSLEHDIAGAAAAGWSTAFVRGGLHAAAFDDGDPTATIARLAREAAAPLPTFSLHHLG